MGDLKATLGKKSKWKLEQACEGGGWLTILTKYHYGTGISR